MNKKYKVIYADPPWRYEHPVSNSRRIENQYPTLKLDDIKRLKIPSEDNSVLFLWATAPKLTEAIEVLESWGYTYRTCLVWDKEVMGMGYWFRNQHELLLVGVKGKVHPPDSKMRIRSVLRQKRGKHSVKPHIIKELIGKWYKGDTLLELFSREEMDGWESIGDSIDGKDIRDVLI